MKHSVASAYHPQTNGLDERTNGTVKRKLSKLIKDHEDKYGKDTDGNPHIWDEKVGLIQFAKNAQQQASIKKQPFQMVFGRVPRTAFKAVMAAIDEDTIMDEVTTEEQQKFLDSRNENDKREFAEISDNQSKLTRDKRRAI